MKKALSPLALAFIGYFLAVSLLRWRLRLDLIWLWMGGLLGLAFVYVDRLLHVYMTRPQEQLSLYVKHFIQQKNYRQALQLLAQRGDEQRFLMIRSVIFMIAFAPLAFYVITSTGSLIAVGMIMGIGLYLLYELLSHLKDLEKLKLWLFWPIKRAVTDTETQVAVYGFAFLFVLLSLLLV